MTDKEQKKFLRQEKIRHIKHKIRMLIPVCCIHGWDNLRYFINPRQKWLTKKIPNHWVDKDVLWEICILEGIKHYVDKDGGLDYYEESQKDPEYPEHQAVFDREMKAAYEDITKTLPEMERKLEDAWRKVPKFDFKSFTGMNTSKDDYDETYGEVDRLEEDINNLKTRIMIWAVQKRASIWT